VAQREPEGRNKPDVREQDSLTDSDRLAQRLEVVTQDTPGHVPEGYEPEDDRGDYQPELPGTQPEEHPARASQSERLSSWWRRVIDPNVPLSSGVGSDGMPVPGGGVEPAQWGDDVRSAASAARTED